MSALERAKPTGAAPAGFVQAIESLRSASVRAEVHLRDAPAPSRLAPFSFAVTAVVHGGEVRGGDVELAGGRLVVLHDPRGHESWQGTTRLVAYVRAELETEIAVDPFLGGVGWSWLLEALDGHGAGYTAAAGTVTRAASESFGAMADHQATAEVEVRASWTPLDDDLAPHLHAWCDLLCHAGGLPPTAPGVRPFPPPRARTTT